MEIDMQRRIAAVIGMGVACGTASAQLATVRVTHNSALGTIAPGETLRVTARLSWTEQMQWAGLRGDLLATDDAGLASNVGFHPFLMPGALVRHGVPVGGSVKGTDIASVPGFFTATVPPPYSNWWGVEFFSYDWTAPSVSAPTWIDFAFVADPDAPNVRLYPTSTSPMFVEAITTYVPASILVVPAPSSLGLAAMLGIWACARRRLG